jgi:hypothetical protein
VYANSARGVGGYAPTALHSSSAESSHPHSSTGSMGYGGGTAFYAPGPTAGYGMGTGLFMSQARKCERLWGLIGAGAGVGSPASSSSDDRSTRGMDSETYEGSSDRWTAMTTLWQQQVGGRTGFANYWCLVCLLVVVYCEVFV